MPPGMGIICGVPNIILTKLIVIRELCQLILQLTDLLANELSFYTTLVYILRLNHV